MVSQWERNASVPRREVAARVDEALDANGEALETFGYMPPGTLRRLVVLEDQARALGQVVELLGRLAIDRLGGDHDLVSRLGALEQLLVPPPAPQGGQ